MTVLKLARNANTDGLINCLRQPRQLRYQLPKSMVLNLPQLIKFSGIKTHPAAETQSIGLPAYAQLAQVFAEPLRQLYRDPKLCAVNRDLSIYRDYPILQLYRDPKLTAVNRDYPISTVLSGRRNFQPSTGTLHLDQKLASIYRDFAKTHASACRGRQLIKPPGR